MPHRTEPRPAPATEGHTVNLPTAAAELLDKARESTAGRAGRTLVPGAGAVLKQALLALVRGQRLADHDSPAAATLQVLVGTVRLSGGEQDVDLHTGDHAPIPPVRHGLQALEDAVVLISVGARRAQSSQPEEESA